MKYRFVNQSQVTIIHNDTLLVYCVLAINISQLYENEYIIVTSFSRFA